MAQESDAGISLNTILERLHVQDGGSVLGSGRGRVYLEEVHVARNGSPPARFGQSDWVSANVEAGAGENKGGKVEEPHLVPSRPPSEGTCGNLSPGHRACNHMMT